MKTTKMKLSLKKSTISNLSQKSLRAVQGGRTEPGGITIPVCTAVGCQSKVCNPGTTIPLSVPNYVTCLIEQCVTDVC
jgi:hypothetical protein